MGADFYHPSGAFRASFAQPDGHPPRRAVLFVSPPPRAGAAPGAEAGRPRDRSLAGLTLHTVELGCAPAARAVRAARGPASTTRTCARGSTACARRVARLRRPARARALRRRRPTATGTRSRARPTTSRRWPRRAATPVDVVAHDFGAAVAVAFAARHLASVRRILLVSPLRDAAQVRAVADRSREALGEEAGGGCSR